MKEITMTYSEYKNNYPTCKTKKDSYDKANKTIIVYVDDNADMEAIEKIKEAANELIALAQSASNKEAAAEIIEAAKWVLSHIENITKEKTLHGTALEVYQQAMGLDNRPSNMTKAQHAAALHIHKSLKK